MSGQVWRGSAGEYQADERQVWRGSACEYQAVSFQDPSLPSELLSAAHTALILSLHGFFSLNCFPVRCFMLEEA